MGFTAQVEILSLWLNKAKGGKMKRLLIFAAILLMVKGVAEAWTVETVVTISDSCKGVGLALDSDNKPHIVYAEKHTDSVNVQEKYKDAGSTWQGPYNTNCPHCEDMEAYGPWNCVSFDAQNDTFWVITLYGYDYNSCIYASYKAGISGAWSPAVQVRSHSGTWPARFTGCDVTVESGKVVHLVYSDYNDTTMYYEKRTGGGWGADENIGTTGMDYGFWYYYGASIALEGTTPHVAGYFYNDDPSYYDILPSYRNKVGGSWGTRIRMSNWGFWPNKGGGYVSLVLNPMGNNYDWACWGNSEGERYVRYGQRSVSGWTGTSPVTPGDMGSGNFCADIVGYAGKVWLAYRANNGDLKFAGYETMGSPTFAQTVDTLPTGVSYVCLKIAPDSSIHIAYFAIEAGSYKIKYAYNPSLGIEDEEVIGHQVIGISIHPNPFREKVEIKFCIGQGAEDRELKIYDVSGRVVKDFGLVTSSLNLSDVVIWDGRDDKETLLPSGVYYCRLIQGGETQTKKVLLVR